MNTGESRSKTPGFKWLARIAIIAVAVVAVIVGLARETDRARQAAAVPVVATSATESSVVRVYYFHGDTRCDTCLSIEEQTARLVRTRFAEEIASNRLRFEVVNFDAPAGRHFRDDFDLAFGAVVVQTGVAPGSWRNLNEVWTLIHEDVAAFDAYLETHIRDVLEKAG